MKNDELIAAGHELAKCLDSNTPLIDIAKLLSKMATQLDVTTAELSEKTKQCEAMAAENAALKSSRAVLAENTFEACNAIASAGFSHEAIMRGLYESTGNGNKYPKPITTLVDEAMRKLETPATDAFLREVQAQARIEGVNFAAARVAAAFNQGFIDKSMAEVHDVVKAVMDAKGELSTAPVDALSGEYAEQALDDWASELRQGGAA
ncbi:hypothetical protein ACI0YR_003933 [Cronobacter dublinensis]